MLENVSLLAPAKINLGLKLGKKRSDGFHSIASIFSTVNLFDELSVSLTENGFPVKKNTCRILCKSELQTEFILPEENTFTKAYKAFCVLTGIDEGVSVLLKKRIPSGGGLGGGSSDASSFIQSLNLLFCTQLSESSQMKLAGLVGSDCYFFTKALCSGKESPKEKYLAFVTGRGENVSEISSRNDFFVLLLFSGVSVSTKIAYNLADKFYSFNSVSIADVSAANDLADKSEFFKNIYKMPVKNWKQLGLVNDFTKPVADAYPKIKEALCAMESAGADFVDMSGSGSTIYGIFEDRNDAENARNFLMKDWQVVLV